MLAVISDAADPSASQPRRRAYGGALRLTYGATVVVMAVRARVCLGLAFQVGGRRSREDWHPRGVDTASHAADSVHDEHREDGGQRRDRAATAPEIGGSVHVPTLRLRFVAGSVALRRPFPASFRREECPKGNDAWREASPGARNSSLPPPPSPDVRFGRRGGSPQLARIGPLLELLHDPGQLPDRGVVQPMRQGLGRLIWMSDGHPADAEYGEASFCGHTWFRRATFSGPTRSVGGPCDGLVTGGHV